MDSLIPEEEPIDQHMRHLRFDIGLRAKSLAGVEDTPVIPLNQSAFAPIHAPKEMTLAPGASHLFAEPGTLAAASGLARDWFLRFLVPEPAEPVTAGV